MSLFMPENATKAYVHAHPIERKIKFLKDDDIPSYTDKQTDKQTF